MKKIDFINLNTQEIKKDIKNAYEEIMKEKIEIGDPAEDFIDWVVYILTKTKDWINFSARMNLLKFSQGEYLDRLGDLVDAARNEEKEAECSVMYTFSKIFDEDKVIPARHKIAKENIYFETIEEVKLKKGSRTATGKVRCLIPGIIGNDIEPGEINKIIDDIPYLLSAQNITKTSGGALRENDESYRERIRLKPKSFSVAGPKGAYKYYTLTAHQDIVDSCIYTPIATPGVVKIIPLLRNGELPTEEIIEKIKKILEDDVRPLTDRVEVEKPVQKAYNINVKYWLKTNEDTNSKKNEIDIALKKYITWQKEKLGRDINPNKLTQFLISAGAKRIEITSPLFTTVEKTEIAKENTVSLKYQGEEDE